MKFEDIDWDAVEWVSVKDEHPEIDWDNLPGDCSYCDNLVTICLTKNNKELVMQSCSKGKQLSHDVHCEDYSEERLDELHDAIKKDMNTHLCYSCKYKRNVSKEDDWVWINYCGKQLVGYPKGCNQFQEVEYGRDSNGV